MARLPDIRTLAASMIALLACRRSPPSQASPTAAPVVVVRPPNGSAVTAPVVVAVPAPAFPEAPQAAGHGTGGTCEAACRVERQSSLRTLCGNDHGAFREMDRECRTDAQRAYRECVARCRH